MIDTTSTTGSTAASQQATSTSSSPATSGVNQDTFLKLLMVQLQNQDPMNPMDDSAFLSQMAQFTSLEQITNLAQQMTTMSFSSQVSQATGLIGHPITWLNADGTTGTGVASKVTVADNKVQIGVGADTVQLSQIESIDPIPQAPTTDPATLAAEIAAAVAAGSTTTTPGATPTATNGTATGTTAGSTTPSPTATAGTTAGSTTSPTSTSGTSTAPTTGTAQP